MGSTNRTNSKFKENKIMNKKLITLLAMVALVSSFLVAAVEVPRTTGYTETMDAGGDGSTVIVAHAQSTDMDFDLEAETAGSTWTNANGLEVFNSEWDVRDEFDAFFRLRATAGSYNGEVPLTITIAVTNLYLDGVTNTTFSNYYEAGVGVVSAATTGTFFTKTNGSFTVGTSIVALPITTKAYHVYGQGGNEVNDSVNFTLTYDGDAGAPAGQYESDVTVTYTNS
jgi:hypothetical protein